MEKIQKITNILIMFMSSLQDFPITAGFTPAGYTSRIMAKKTSQF